MQNWIIRTSAERLFDLSLLKTAKALVLRNTRFTMVEWRFFVVDLAARGNLQISVASLISKV